MNVKDLQRARGVIKRLRSYGAPQSALCEGASGLLVVPNTSPNTFLLAFI